MKTKFAAVQLDGKRVFVSGIGATEKAAVKDAHKYCDVKSPLRTVMSTEQAIEAVKIKGGDAKAIRKTCALVLITRDELRALAMFQQAARYA
jgi:hypothetical protein